MSLRKLPPRKPLDNEQIEKLIESESEESEDTGDEIQAVRRKN